MPGESQEKSGSGLSYLGDSRGGHKDWPSERYEMWVEYGYLYNAIANNPIPYELTSGNGSDVINRVIEKLTDPKARKEDIYSFFGVREDPSGALDADGSVVLEDDGTGKTSDANNRIRTCKDIIRVRGMINSVVYDKGKPEQNGLQGFHDYHLADIAAVAKSFSIQKYGDDGNGNPKQMLSNSDFAAYAKEKTDRETAKYYKDIKALIEGYDKPMSDKKGSLVKKYIEEQKNMNDLENSISHSRKETVRKFIPTALSFAGFGAGVAGVLSGGGGLLSGLIGMGAIASPLGIFVVGGVAAIAGFSFLKHFGGKLLSQLGQTSSYKEQYRKLKNGAYKQASITLKGAIAAKNYMEKGKFASKREKKDFERACRQDSNFKNLGIDSKDKLDDERVKFIKNNKLTDVVNKLQYPAKAMNSYDTTSVASLQSKFQQADNDPNFFNSYNLSQLSKEVSDLKKYESEIKKNPDSNAHYESYLRKIDSALLDSVKNGLFENAYTTNTVSDVKRITNEANVKERIEHSLNGPLTNPVNNFLEFAGFEANSDGSYGSLSTNLSTSIENQMIMDQAHMEKAVESFGELTNPAFRADTSLKVFVIANSRSRSELENALNTMGGIPPKTKKYLEYICEKKMNACARTEDEIKAKIGGTGSDVDTIAKAISEIKESEALKTSEIAGESTKMTQIRQQINNSSLEKEEKEKAIELLEEQYKSFEVKRRNEVKAKALEAVKNNSEDGLAEYIKKINGVTDETANGVYAEINDIDNEDIKDYLKIRLSEELQKKIDLKIKNLASKNVNIADLTNLLKSIATDTVMTQYQKEQLYKTIENKKIVSYAITPQLDSYEKDFIGLSDEDKSKIKKLTKTYNEEGLGEYFDLGTPEGLPLKERIERLKDNFNAADAFKIEGGSVGGFTKTDDDELKSMSKLLFNRNFNEKLSTTTSTLSSDKQTLMSLFGTRVNEFSKDSPNEFDATKLGCKEGSFVKSVYDKIDNYSTGAYPDNDKLLYLMQLKRICMVAFKRHIKNFVKDLNINTDYESLHSTNPELARNIEETMNKWKTIANEIDDKIRNIVDNTAESKVASIYNGSNHTTFSSYIDKYSFSKIRENLRAETPEMGG